MQTQVSFHHSCDASLTHGRWVSDPLDSFTFGSRFFPLNYNPYVDFSTVLRAGIAAEFEEAPADDLSEDGDDL